MLLDMALDAGALAREMHHVDGAFEHAAPFQMEMDARFHKERAAQIGAGRDGQRAAALLRQMVDTRLNGRCGECRAIGPRAEIADRGGFLLRGSRQRLAARPKGERGQRKSAA
jgi:hypothetical protein